MYIKYILNIIEFLCIIILKYYINTLLSTTIRGETGCEIGWLRVGVSVVSVSK